MLAGGRGAASPSDGRSSGDQPGGASGLRRLALALLISLGALGQLPQAVAASGPAPARAASEPAAAAPSTAGARLDGSVGRQTTAGPGYITLLLGRTMYGLADSHCNELPGSVDLDHIA